MRYIAVRAYEHESNGEHLVVDLEAKNHHPVNGEPEWMPTVVQSGLSRRHARLLAASLNEDR